MELLQQLRIDHGVSRYFHGYGFRKAVPEREMPGWQDCKGKDARNGARIRAQSRHGAAAPVNQTREESCRKGPAAGVPLQKAGPEHQVDLQDDGTALLYRARLAVAHAGARAQGQVRQEAGPEEVQDAQVCIQVGQALAEEEVRKVWV